MATLSDITAPKTTKTPVPPTERTRRKLARVWPASVRDVIIHRADDGKVWACNSYALAVYAAGSEPATALGELLDQYPGHGWFTLRATKPAEPSRSESASIPNLTKLITGPAGDTSYREATELQPCMTAGGARVRARVPGLDWWAYFDPAMIRSAVSATPDNFTLMLSDPRRPGLVLDPDGYPVGLAMPVKHEDHPGSVMTPDGLHYLNPDGSTGGPVNPGE